MKSVIKYISEGLVIVFSILGAFWLEEYRDKKNESEEVMNALMALREEIKQNHIKLKSNYDFFNNMSFGLSLTDRFGRADGYVELRKDSYDSITSRKNSHINLEVIECNYDSTLCVYSMNMNFFKIPDFPINSNIWNSIKNSSVASKIDYKIMGIASEFYQSWSHEEIEELLVYYNMTFIGESGDLDVIPPPKLFLQLKTLHFISLSSYEENMEIFNSEIKNIYEK